MKLTIDSQAKTLTHDENGRARTLDLYSREAFELISKQWLKIGWNQKYVYTFTWMGRPLIQLPEDVLRIQETIYEVQPDVLIETGVAHGGSLVLYASLFKAIGRGRVVGIDIEIRPHNRRAIEAHPLSSMITLIEGSSIAPEIVAAARGQIKAGEKVMVILDSNHTKAHVAAELEAYAPLVTAGSYIVATDGSMGILDDVPRGKPEWKHDNPTEAASEFAAAHPEFVLGDPPFAFNESELSERITHWPGAYLKRRT